MRRRKCQCRERTFRLANRAGIEPTQWQLDLLTHYMRVQCPWWCPEDGQCIRRVSLRVRMLDWWARAAYQWKKWRPGRTDPAARCPYLVGEGTCGSGCREEPDCITGAPEEGWHVSWTERVRRFIRGLGK